MARNSEKKSEKSGKIRFIHSDGKEHYFYSVINDMTGDRMTAFDLSAPSINDETGYVKSVFRNIRKNAQVLEVIGDF